MFAGNSTTYDLLPGVCRLTPGFFVTKKEEQRLP